MSLAIQRTTLNSTFINCVTNITQNRHFHRVSRAKKQEKRIHLDKITYFNFFTFSPVAIPVCHLKFNYSDYVTNITQNKHLHRVSRVKTPQVK